MSDAEARFGKLPLDILRSVGVMIEQLSPEVLRSLGSIATQGASPETQAWIEALTDAADDVTRALAVIYAGINDTPTYPPSVEQPTAVSMTEEQKEPQAAEQPVDTHSEFMPPGESGRLKRALEFIDQASRRVNIAEIVRTVFGDRIPDEDYQQFLRELNAGLASHSLTHRGPYYWKRGPRKPRQQTPVTAPAAPPAEAAPSDVPLELRVEVAGEDHAAPVAENAEPVALEEAIDTASAPEVLEEAPQVETTHPMIEEPEPAPKEDIDSLPSRLAVSPNERAALRNAIDYLREFEDRQNLRSIVSAAFGRSRLSRPDEARLVQLLDACTAVGILRSYGRTYGFKTESERVATQASMDIIHPEELPTLEGFEKEIVDYIYEHAENGEINIGQVVRGYFRVQRLEGNDFYAVIDQLNELAARGYLIHAPGSPWYGIKQEAHKQSGVEVESNVEILPHIKASASETVPAPSEPTELRPDEVIELQDEPRSADTPDEQSADEDRATEAVPEPVELEGLARDVYEFVKAGQLFRMEELHKGVSSVAALSQKDYVEFKQNFAELREKIIAYLESNGVAAHWHEEGRNRGKKYQLIIDSISLPAEPAVPKIDSAAVQTPPVSPPATEPSRAPEPPRPKYYDQLAEVTDAAAARMDELAPTNTDEDMLGLDRVDRYRHLLGRVRTMEDKAGTVGIKSTVIAKELARVLGINDAAAKKLVKAFQHEGWLRVPSTQPHHKGTPILTTQQVDEENADKVATAGTPNGRKDKIEEAKKWTAEDVYLAARVFEALITLQHVQQGMSTKDLARHLGFEDSEEFRRGLRRMEARNLLLIDKKANPNTRSPHSKRLQIPMIKLPSQEFKERWKQDRGTVIAELEGLVEVTETTDPEDDQTSQKVLEAARIQSLREMHGPAILKFLSGLEKFQSEYKTAIAAAVGEDVDVEDIQAICQLLRSEGLVEAKMPKGRGTGRTRKGTTWMLTSRGRGAAQRLMHEGQLSAAQKKRLSNTVT